jgi:aspartate racemase
MKTIGLIGGLTWVSTVEYYNILNNEITKRLGGYNAANIILHSVNFGEYKLLAEQGRWDEIGSKLNVIALKLESAGAEMLVICSNTPHKVSELITESLTIPFIHIGDVTADEVNSKGINKVALLGTKYTMEGTFYSNKLSDRGIETIIPDESDRIFIHNSIFDELGKNIFSAATKTKYIGIISNLISRGAKGIILGCTEIPLLIKQEDSPVPVFDTMLIHAKSAVEFALSE